MDNTLTGLVLIVAGLISAFLFYWNRRLSKEVSRLRRLEIQLTQDKEAAEAANRNKSLFFSSMSHDLRSPLNAVLGYAQILLADSSLSRKQQEKIQIMHNSGEQLLACINDIADLYKAEARVLPLHEHVFALRPLLEEIISTLKSRPVRNGVAISGEFDQSLPGAVITDNKRLRQLLLSLLDSAVERTEKGAVVLQVKQSDEGERDWVSFEVRDSGNPITQEELQWIFDPFTPVQKTVQIKKTACLGLALSRQLVNRLGGVLEVTSAVDDGNRFLFKLSLPQAGGAVEKPQVRHTTNIQSKRGRHSILVVDDDDNHRREVRDVLVTSGYSVETVSGGTNAVESALMKCPELVLLDLSMQGMDAYQVLTILRQAPGLAGLPVVAMSGVASQKTRALAAGCDGFVSKPTGPDELLQVISGLLRESGQQKGQEMEQQKVDPLPREEQIPQAPPPEELNALREWVSLGKMGRIIQWAEILEEKMPQYAEFARRARDFAEAVDDRQLLALIDQSLTRISHQAANNRQD